jgi:nicotinate-nucleotide adenylyltransferase
VKSKKPANAERLLPPHAPGMRIGLFGGTFDPPHQAHLAAALLALKRLKLDRVWWLVTPGNPLKNTRGLAPLAKRIAAARALTSHPRIDITGLEAVIKTRYTYDTISWLLARCPGVRFVWIMGADNLRSFHRWQKWRKIVEMVPIVVIDRLGPSLYAAASPAGNVLARDRIPEHDAAALPDRKPPVWAYLHGLKSPLSSTALRALRTGDGTPEATLRKSSKGPKRSKNAKKPKRAKKAGKKRGNKAPKRRIAAQSRKRVVSKSRRRPGNKSRRRQGRKKRAR